MSDIPPVEMISHSTARPRAESSIFICSMMRASDLIKTQVKNMPFLSDDKSENHTSGNTAACGKVFSAAVAFKKKARWCNGARQ